MSTVAMIQFLHESSYSEGNRALLQEAILLPFFWMLRVSEFTCLSRNRFDAEVDLLVSDITFNTKGTLMFVRIKASKTDPFRVGVTLRRSNVVSSIWSSLCVPVIY